MSLRVTLSLSFIFHDRATSEVYTLSLHDALPICASLVPVMVTSICLVMRLPFWSLSVMVKLSTLVWSLARYSTARSEEHKSELQSRVDLVWRLLLELTEVSEPSVVPTGVPVADTR